MSYSLNNPVVTYLLLKKKFEKNNVKSPKFSMNYQNNLQDYFFYLDDTLDHTFYFTFLIPHNIASDLLQSISEL